MRAFLTLMALFLLTGAETAPAQTAPAMTAQTAPAMGTAQAAPATVDRRAAVQEGMRCLKDATPPDVSGSDRNEFCLCVAASLRESVPAQTLVLARTTAASTDAEKKARLQAADHILQNVTVPCLSLIVESIESRRCVRPVDSKNMQHCGCVGASMGIFVFDYGTPLLKASQHLAPNTASPLMLLFTSGDYINEVKKAGQACKFKS